MKVIFNITVTVTLLMLGLVALEIFGIDLVKNWLAFAIIFIVNGCVLKVATERLAEDLRKTAEHNAEGE